MEQKQYSRPIRIACVGASITYGVGASEPSKSYPGQLAAALGDGYEIRNFGISRSYMVDNVEDYPDQVYASHLSSSYKQSALYQDSLRYGADIVLINLGANDAYIAAQNPYTYERFRDSAIAMVNAYRQASPNTTVYLMYPTSRFDRAERRESVKNVIIPAIDAAAKELGCKTIDLFSIMDERALAKDKSYFGDGVHPTDKGYAEMVKVILPEIRAYRLPEDK